MAMRRSLVLLALVALSACSASSTPNPSGPDASTTSSQASFVVKGTTGKDALLDRKWLRGCIPGSNGVKWTEASRTLVGLELTFTLVDYQNTSETPDCKTGRVGSAVFSMTLTNDQKLVPITWVDPNGNAASAPSGLESVKNANAATARMTSATITPATAERAAQLNSSKFCNKTDWAAGVGFSAVECLTGGVNPFKATLVVDDRATPWKIYDAVGTKFDDAGYPIDMANYLPHAGPFPLE